MMEVVAFVAICAAALFAVAWRVERKDRIRLAAAVRTTCLEVQAMERTVLDGMRARFDAESA